MPMMPTIPVILFAYNRPEHLQRTLQCLRENHIPLLHVFSDGPRTVTIGKQVQQVRQILHEIDWCQTVICERKENLGLGRSIRAGVSEVLEKHASAIIFEDDLICVPGTYDYLCAALRHYQDSSRVMSVTGWTHPRITPHGVANQPYFDGRAECLVWGTWARAWKGMETDARTLVRQCRERGIDIYRYGADLPEMARTELRYNIWAVRLLYWHILNQGLCVRPPWSMVEHIGFDQGATNARKESWIASTPLAACPPIPDSWPAPVENPDCAALHRTVCGARPTLSRYPVLWARRMAISLLYSFRRWRSAA
jgi:hypothetical protein